MTHSEAAVALGLSPGTIRNRVKPFRERFQVLLREQIGKTVQSPLEIEEELRHLIRILSA